MRRKQAAAETSPVATRPSIKNRRGSGQDGFSLIELMITSLVFLIITCSIFSVMKSSFGASITAYEMTDAQESLRFAQEQINRDLLNVGEGLKAVGSVRLPVSFVKTYLSSRTQAQLDPDGDGSVSISIVTSEDNAASTPIPGGNTPLSVRAGTDRITLLSADPIFDPLSLPPGSITPSGSNVSIASSTAGGFNIGEIYYITNGSEATFGTITNITGGSNPNLIFAAGDVYGLNQPGNGGPINVVSDKGNKACSLMRMSMFHYFVDSNGLFVRRTFGVGGAGFSDSIIAEHVVNMQFLYYLNLRDANGNLRQPVTSLSNSDQQAVRMVEATITAETVHKVVMGQRQQISSTAITAVRNLQFRHAQQPN